MVRNFYEPTPPVDWTKKLEEVYARQTRQLEEHHANLRARDQQMVDKAQSENVTKLFSSLAGFSQAAASLGNKNKERKAEKQKEDFALLRSS
jgi:t-SNARE complex subunit (syntaxin)